MTAADFVLAAMRDVLPDGVPLAFTLTGARFTRRGASAGAVAEVVMFDGLPATLEVHRWGLSHRHRWTAMAGGDACWEDGRWMRVAEAEGRS